MASEFHPQTGSFGTLRDKVIVLSGGASGIGRAVATLAVQAGAYVFFGDVVRPAGEELALQLGDRATFMPCDATVYGDVYALFMAAYERHGRVDHAVCCAGILERGRFFDPGLNVESVGRDMGDMTVLDVNLQGSLSFARIAVVFQRGSENASLTFVSSIAALRDSPGMVLYQTSKTALMGLARSMRGPIYEQFGVRTVVVCPGMTESAMTKDMLIPKFRDQAVQPGVRRFWQSAEQVAEMILGVMVEREMNGKSLYVEGGRAWEFEDGLAREMPQWLGEEPTAMLRDNVKFIRSLGGIKGDQKK